MVTFGDTNNCRPVVLADIPFLVKAYDPLVVIIKLDILHDQRTTGVYAKFWGFEYLSFTVVKSNDQLPSFSRVAIRPADIPSKEVELVDQAAFDGEVFTNIAGHRRNIVVCRVIYICEVPWKRKNTTSLQHFCLVHVAVKNYQIIGCCWTFL